MIRACILILLVCLVGCGKPSPEDRPIRPSKIMDFDTLFAQRCAGCHGKDGAGSGSIALHDPTLMNIISRETLHDLVKNGRPGTLMPSFQSNTGNPLTDAQIEILVDGMMQRWSEDAPPWATDRRYEVQQGKATRGKGAFVHMCGQCHGNDGLGASAGSVINPAFLELVSAQYLRTVILCGRPELGMPQLAGKIEDQTIDDIVAWLRTHKTFRSDQ
jgi:cytochrome c oxidase cbb3-type subunit 3